MTDLGKLQARIDELIDKGLTTDEIISRLEVAPNLEEAQAKNA
jgi:hypothetical protein